MRSTAMKLARPPLRRLKRIVRRVLPAKPPPGGKPRLQVRREFVLGGTRSPGLILEIGPAHNPILPKRDGYHTRTADYTDRDGLVAKYRQFPKYSPDDIEEVDYIIPVGSSLRDAIDARFDLVVASHVLEHTVSVIDFLNDCTSLLAPGGVLALVVPDHRYCFDRFRERSSIARVIDVSRSPRTVHTVGTVTEFALNAVRHRGTTSWTAGHKGRYQFVNDLDSVQAKAAEAAAAAAYMDVHNWVFSPNHLRLLLDDLHALGLISLREAAFQDTIGHEFFLRLTVDGPGPGLTRQQLVMLADAERRVMDVPAWERPSEPAEAPGRERVPVAAPMADESH